MRNISTLNEWSGDSKALLCAYDDFMQESAYKQKSYLNFLSFLKKQKDGYCGFSAGKIGDIFALKWAYNDFAQDGAYKQKNYLNFLNFLKTKKDGYWALSAGEIGDIFEDLKTPMAAQQPILSKQEVPEAISDNHLPENDGQQEHIDIPAPAIIEKTLYQEVSVSEIGNVLEAQNAPASTPKLWILGKIRNAFNTRVAATLAFFSVISIMPSNINESKAESPDIYGIEVAPGNAKKIQQAAQSDLQSADAAETKQKLEDNVHTTPQERTTLQNYAVNYAFNHKVWSVDKKDGSPQEFMDATLIYTDLASTLAWLSTYAKPNLSPEQKVVYDIIFCLEQLWYNKASDGQSRDFDKACCTYTNDLVIAIMEFQKNEGIRIDAIVGPETFWHLNDAIGQDTKNNTLIITDITVNDQGNVVAYDTNVSVNNVIDTNQTVIIDTPQNVVEVIEVNATSPSDFQLTLEKYLIGREIGFVEEAMDYINEKRNNYEQLIIDITAIENSTNPDIDKKALMLSKLKEYGIENKIIILEKQINEHRVQQEFWPELDDLCKQKDELLRKSRLSGNQQNVFDYSPDSKDVDSKLAKKVLQKPKIMKLKNTVNDIITEKLMADTNVNNEIGTIFSTTFYDELQTLNDPQLIEKFTRTYDIIFIHEKKKKIPEMTDAEAKLFRATIKSAYDKSIIGQSQETIAILFMQLDQQLYWLKQFNYIEDFHSGIDAKYYDVTWTNLIKRWVLPEDLCMTFDEFSGLQPATIFALLNHNIDLNKDDRKTYNCKL